MAAPRSSPSSALYLRDPLPPRASEHDRRARAAGAATRRSGSRWRVVVGLARLFCLWWVDRLRAVRAHPRRARGRARHLRHRQAVDVEVRLSRRAATRSSTLYVPGGPPGQADHDLARRHPQLLRARLPHEAGRGARAATPRCGSRRPSPARYQILCAEYCGTGHSHDARRGRGAGARRLRALARGRPAEALAGPSTSRERRSLRARERCRWCGSASASPPSTAACAATRSTARRTSGRPGPASTARRSRSTAARRVDRRRGLPDRVDDGSAGQDRSPASSR